MMAFFGKFLNALLPRVYGPSATDVIASAADIFSVLNPVPIVREQSITTNQNDHRQLEVLPYSVITCSSLQFFCHRCWIDLE